MKSPITFWFQCRRVSALSRARTLFQLSAFSISAFCFLVLSPGAPAATITWGSATTITADSDVSTSGVLKFAYCWGTAATVNGVAFTQTTSGTAAGTDVSLTSFGTRDAAAYGASGTPYNNLSANYQNIVKGGAYGANSGTGGTASGTITLNGLTVGRYYLVQIWVQDGRAGSAGGGTATRTETPSGGSALSYYVGGSASSLAGGVGQYVTGTFTADATTQAISVSATGGATSTGSVQINAIEVRDTSSANGTWNTATSGLNWSTVGNWLGSTIANDIGATADFSKVNITTDPTVVNLDSSRTLGNLIFGDTDTTSAAGWSLTGNTLTLSATTPTITVNALGFGKAASIASSLAGAAGLTKTGAGALTLNGSAVNPLTGGLKINSGTLTLDYSSYNGNQLVNSGNALTLGGGTLSLLGNNTASAANTQTFASTTVNSGFSPISLAKGASATSVTLNLGQVTLNSGGVTIFTPTTSWSTTASTTENVFVTTGGSIAVPGSGTAWTRAGIMYGVGGTRWAQVNSSGQLLGAPSSTALAATSASATTVNSISSSDITFSIAATSSYGLLLNSSGGTRTVNIPTASTYTLNGIIGIGSTASAIAAAGTGKVVIGAEKDFVINLTTSSGLTISAPIDNNGGGVSTLTVNSTSSSVTSLTGVNTYTGPTYINSGTLSISADTGFGTAPASATANMIVLNGGSLSAGFNGSISVNRGMTIGANGGTILSPVSSLTYQGIIAGSGPLTINTTSGGILYGASGSTYSGGTTLSGSGTLYPVVSSIGSPGSPTSGPFGTGTLTLNGSSMRPSTGVALDPVIIGNPVVIAANTAFSSANGEKNLTLTGPVTLTGSRTLTVSLGNGTLNTDGTGGASGKAVTFSGIISDGGSAYGITQNGTGTGKLILSGANSYTGPTVISSAILQIGSGGTSGSLSPSSSITDNGTLTFNRSDDIVQGTHFANNITGTGGLTKSGAGKLTVGANGYSGQTTVNGGTLTASDVASFGTSSQINVGGGTLQLATDSSVNAYNLSLGGSTSGTLIADRATAGAAFTETLGQLRMSASTTLNFNKGGNVSSGTPVVSFTSMIMSSGVGGGTSTLNPTTASVTIVGGASTTTTPAKTLALSGTSTGNSIGGNVTDGSNPVSLTKANSSTWTLNGANNNYSGNTTISGGTLVLGSGATIPSSPTISVASGAFFDVTTPGLTISALQTLTGAGTVSGTVTSNGKITPGSSGVGTLTIDSLTLNAGSTLDFEFPVSGANDLVNATVSGGLTLNGGAFNLYQTGTTTAFTQNGTYNLLQYSGTLNGNAANLSVANPQSSKTYLFSTDGTYIKVTIGDAPTPEYWGFDVDGSWGDSSKWNLATVPNVQFASANFGGSGSPTFTGPHTVTLDGNNTIGSLTFNTAQPFTINQGSGGSLLFDNGNGTALITDTLGSHTVNAPMSLSTAGAAVSVASGETLNLNRAVAAAGNISKSGSGTLVFGADNNAYSGQTIISGGTLRVGAGGVAGSLGSGAVVNNAALVFDRSDSALNAANAISGTGTLTKNGSGTVTFSGVSSYTNTTFINSGILVASGGSAIGDASAVVIADVPGVTLQLNNNETIGSLTGGGSGGAVNLQGNMLTLAANVTTNYAGTISGSGGALNKAGGGTLTLFGANTYSGGTILTNAIIVASNNAAIGTGPLSIGLGATRFVVADGAVVANSISISGGGVSFRGLIENSGAGIAVLSNAVISISAPAAAGGHFASTGGGVLTIWDVINSVTNVSMRQGTVQYGGGGTYTNFIIYEGTARLLAHNGLSTAVTADLGATSGGTAVFDLAGFNQALGGITRSSGSSTSVVTNSATGSDSVLTLTGTSSYPGSIKDSGVAGSRVALTISGGSVTLSGANTYTGNTIVNAGTLALSGSGSIANSASVVVRGNTVFDVSGLSSAFVLGANQTLSNSAVAAIISGANNCSAGTISLVYDGVNPSFIITNGGMTLSAVTTIKVNNIGAALLPGTYKIISKATAGNVGLVAGTVPSAVVVTGGQPSGGTPSLSLVNGELYLTVGGNSSVGYTGSPFTYNGSAQTPAVAITGSTGAATTNYVGTGATTYASVNAPTNAGTYYVSNTVAADANYFGITNSQAFTINPALASVTADAKTKSYGAVNPTLTATVVGQVIGGDPVNYSLSTDAAQFSAVGVSNIFVTLGSNPNYSVLTTNNTLTITPAITFVGVSSTNNPSGYKDAVSFQATLPADATGSLVFSSTNGAFSTNPVSGPTTASLSITNLPRGTNLITVAYLGDGNYVGSTNTLDQIVTNHPPVVNPVTYTRNAAVQQTKFAVTNLLSNATDADGDTLTLVSVGATTNAATLIVSGGWVLYYNTNAVNDEFTYTVSDGFGGTNSATVIISLDSTPLFGQSTLASITGGTATLNFAGIPSLSYSVLRSTNLTSWETIWTTNASGSGAFQYIDTSAPQPSAYYRLQYNH